MATKVNLALEINQNLLVKEELIDHQEMERKKALATKVNLVSLKKITQNQLVLQIIQNTLERKHLTVHQLVVDKKSPSFGVKKKFKSRSDRPKNFTFKKHSQKRSKV